MSIPRNLSIIADTLNANGTFASITDTGNLTFTGTGNRITGDFSNATASNRVSFQTSTVNGNTVINAIPNGTSVTSVFRTFNAADPTNASQATFGINGTNAFIDAGLTGTGSYLPIAFTTNGTTKLTVAADTTGTITIGGTAPRITGDFSNATVASRVMFQTSTTNSQTAVGILPNGTANTSNLLIYSSSSDPANSSLMQMRVGGDGGLNGLAATITGTGSYLPLMFWTGGSERMRLDTSGNVGIGTSSPSAKLDITGSGGQISKFQNFAGSSGIDAYVAEGTSAAPTALISGRQIMNYRSYGYDGASYIFVGGIDMQAESAFSVGTNPTYLRFRTSPSSGTGTERMRIDSSGNVLVGTTTAGAKLTVAGNAATPTSAVTFSATAMTLNCALSNVFTTTFTANVTTAPTLSNPADGQTLNWFITQDATGTRTMTWPTSFKWPGGTAGVLSTAANSVDLLVATYRSATGFWYATLSKGFA